MTDLMKLALEDLESAHRKSIRNLSARVAELRTIEHTLAAARAHGAIFRIDGVLARPDGEGQLTITGATPYSSYPQTRAALEAAGLQPHASITSWWLPTDAGWRLALFQVPDSEVAEAEQLPEQVAA